MARAFGPPNPAIPREIPPNSPCQTSRTGDKPLTPSQSGGDGGTAGAGGSIDASTDSALDASTDSPVGDGDASDAADATIVFGDPCPATISLNCGAECGPVDAKCAAAECGMNTPTVTIADPSKLPFVIRTPSKPGTDPNCAAACGVSWLPASTYGVGVSVAVPNDPSKQLKATIGAPWRVLMTWPDGDWCIDATSQPLCKVWNFNSYAVVAFITDDPNAPARNGTIEEVPKGTGVCP